jgi:hypothetical protein
MSSRFEARYACRGHAVLTIFRTLNIGARRVSIGDGIDSSFDAICFVLILAGIPTLILGLPVGVLVYLSARTRRHIAANGDSNSPRRSKSVAWLFALLAVLAVGVVVFLMTAVGFTSTKRDTGRLTFGMGPNAFLQLRVPKRYNELEETTNVGLATALSSWDNERIAMPRPRWCNVRCTNSLSPLIRCILLRLRSTSK